MRKVLEKCPACGGVLAVTRMGCQECDTGVEGTFSTCPFCSLTAASLDFVVTFVKNRGNLKEIERELGIPYPTLRGRLSAVLRELGFEPAADAAVPEDELASRRRAVLEQLERGEVTADQAIAALAEIR